MNGQQRRVSVLVGLVIFVGACLSSALAQDNVRPGDLTIRKVTQQLRRAPDYGGTSTALGSQVSGANRPWLHIEVEFSSELEWADEVLLKYYALVGEGREARLLTGDVVHVNVPKGTRRYSAMFLHPNTVQRFGKGKVEAIAVQLFYRGRLMDQTSEPPARTRWWEQLTPTPGFLLRPSDTPWSVVAHERYEAYKASP
ncbi:MAG: hypothetical protein NZ483_00240 [Verrucomicrobiae bacterium]|nr:hypothetical protein [Verrucomicrobiae bacterium]